MKYTPVIGLEIHAELLTNTKIFCSCKNEFGKVPNTRICPVCSGMPGALPTLNKNAVILGIKAGLALNCKINTYSAFDRKNYFYPDLPKGYQITQFYHPLCSNGKICIDNKIFNIEQIHLEEDAGKLIHDENISKTAIDYNRCGIPLIEIVTKPDFNSADEVCSFVEDICQRLKYQNICDARLEQGSLRVDVNISLKEKNSKVLGTRAEIKNLNSLKSIKKAIEFETNRQSKLLDKGEKVIQETRRFDECSATTKSLREKEGFSDYRYFPEPDLPAIYVTEDEISNIKFKMCQMPEKRLNRYINEYGLSFDDAKLITHEREYSDFYDEVITHCNEYKAAASLMLGELNKHLNLSGKKISDLMFTPKMFAELLVMTVDKKVNISAAKEILAIMFKTGENALNIATKNNLLSDFSDEKIIICAKKVLSENQENIKKYKSGKTQLFGFFVGEIFRLTNKKADPVKIRNILEKILSDEN